ncbi:MAG: hypothetical protein AAB592_03515 [Patescibacteria group bacterium]
MDKIQKFLKKLRKKERQSLLKIFADIFALEITSYDVKQLHGQDGMYRLRKGNIRIVFVKKDGNGIIVAADYRQGVCKKL